jgi:hypothetical protein
MGWVKVWERVRVRERERERERERVRVRVRVRVKGTVLLELAAACTTHGAPAETNGYLSSHFLTVHNELTHFKHQWHGRLLMSLLLNSSHFASREDTNKEMCTATTACSAHHTTHAACC